VRPSYDVRMKEWYAQYGQWLEELSLRDSNDEQIVQSEQKVNIESEPKIKKKTKAPLTSLQV
jgi:hypothetical protein